MNNLVVVLDPGHTQNYNKGVAAGYYEGNMTLDLAQRLKAELEKYGAEVYLTRTSGAENPSLDARGKLAITKGATLFISLHSDASSSANTSWVTVIRSLKRPNSVGLGQKLAAAIAGLMGTKLSGYSGASGGVWTRKYPGYSTLDYYGVIRAAVASGNVQDAFLIEHGFHTNPNDCAFLDSSARRAELAAAEAKVIAEHYGLTASDPTAGLPTYKIGPVSRGDAERVVDLAKDMDVACMGTFEFGPVSSGDAARLQALAKEIGVGCTAM